MSLENEIVSRNVRDVSISETCLPRRIKNICNETGVNTIGQLLQIPEENLLCFRGFGKGSLQDLRETIYRDGELRSYGEITGQNASANPQILEKPVSELNFPARVQNTLYRLGINTVGQLINTPYEELLAIKNFGRTSLSAMRRILRNYGVDVDKPKPRVKLTDRIDEIRKLAEDGLTRREIASAVSRSYEYIGGLIREYDIEVEPAQMGRPRRGLKIRPEIDRMIVEGKTLGKMAKETGQTEENMRQYINKRGVHEYWRRQRRKASKEESFRTNVIKEKREVLVSAAVSGVLRHALKNEDDWATRKAVEYKQVIPRSSYSIERLEKIFRVYQEARKNGERLSLKEIENRSGTGAAFPHIRRIWCRVGIKPMHGSILLERERLSDKELKAISRATKIKMPSNDLAYFMNINSWNVRKRFREGGIRRPEVKRELKRFGALRTNGVLSYRLASQIYEAQDAGYFREFSRDEMAGFFDTSREVIDYTLSERKRIAPRISRALKGIYPKRKSKRPYRTKGDVL
ncbi:hypothetical protein HY450_01960 [Candidatus Pacearchaeota archaeon]|nr:hypothetical protein [Candidatus Pacearchaeota archaeon]